MVRRTQDLGDRARGIRVEATGLRQYQLKGTDS